MNRGEVWRQRWSDLAQFVRIWANRGPFGALLRRIEDSGSRIEDSRFQTLFQLKMNRIDIVRYNLKQRIPIWKARLRQPRTWAVLIGGTLGFLILIAAVTYVAFAADMGSKQRIVNAKDTGVILYDRAGRLLYESGGAHDIHYTTLDQISPQIQHAIVSIEDKTFYQNPGFSPDAILRSAYADLMDLDPTKYGGSTITQQLVKNALLDPHKDFLRKYQEIVLSIEIARRYSKNEVLEMYLNSVYYGAGAYGIEQAAQTYFGKEPNQVDLAQAALLAALPAAPSYLSPLTADPALAKARQEIVLDDMYNQGYITAPERDQAKAEVLHYQPLHQTLGAAPHFALWILQQLRDKYGEDYVGRAGLHVTTSLDLDLQEKAQDIVQKQVTSLSTSHVSNGAALVLDPKTGEVLAMVGSADYENDAIDGKVNDVFALRQPGSSIKPIIYLKAMETKQFTAATVLHDVPTDFGGGYMPHDADGKYRGDVLARFALANSLNIPSVELLKDLGVPSALEMANRLHITTLTDPNRCGLTLILGGCEVKLFELTRAYGVLANYGNYVDTTPILKIVDRDGNTVFTPDTKKQNLVDPAFTYIISNILSDSNARAMEFGTLLNASHPAAVKTGTTENFRDAWAMGYTPNLVVGVWMGNNDGTDMTSIFGALGPIPVWKQIMEAGWAKYGYEGFKEPAGIERALVCRSDGLLSYGGTDSYEEVFAQGTLPTGHCNEPAPVATPSATPSATTGEGGTGGNGGTGGSINVATPSASSSAIPNP